MFLGQNKCPCLSKWSFDQTSAQVSGLNVEFIIFDSSSLPPDSTFMFEGQSQNETLALIISLII